MKLLTNSKQPLFGALSSSSGTMLSLKNSDTPAKEVLANEQLIMDTIDQEVTIENLHEDSLTRRWGLWDIWVENPLYHAIQDGNVKLFNAANRAHLHKYEQAKAASLRYSQVKCEQGLAAMSIYFQNQFYDFVMGQHNQLQARIAHHQRVFRDIIATEQKALESYKSIPELYELQLQLMQSRFTYNSNLVQGLFQGFAKAVDSGAPNFLISSQKK